MALEVPLLRLSFCSVVRFAFCFLLSLKHKILSTPLDVGEVSDLATKTWTLKESREAYNAFSAPKSSAKA